MYPKLSRNNTKWYLKIRRDILNGRITRQTLKSFKKIEDKKQILLHRFQENDFSIFFKACIMNLNHVINFSFKECDINPQDIRQSLVEMEEKLYECKSCNMTQCNIDKKVNEIFTPLMFVIWFAEDKSNIENLLVQKNFLLGIDAQSFPLGITPLQLACSKNCLETVRLLIDKGGADVTKLDNMNKSVLMYALLGGNCWKLCLVYHNNNNNDDDDDDENTKYKICILLLENGADEIIDEKEKSTGFNAIDIATKLGYPSVVQLFETYKRTAGGGDCPQSLPPQ